MAFVGGQVDKTPAGDPLHAYDLATQTQVVIRHIDTGMLFFAGFSQERMHSLRADVVILGHDSEAFKHYKTSYES
jgi:hypothetical protein